jgi:hypothetical protein
MSYKYEHSIVVDGITVRYDKCSHCNALPTIADIRKQFEIVDKCHWEPCVVCGLKSKVLEVSVRHSKDGTMDRWGGDVLLNEQMIELTGYNGRHHIKITLHPKCAEKALPKVKFSDTE